MKAKLILFFMVFLCAINAALGVSHYYEINLIYNDSKITYEYVIVSLLQADEQIGNLPGSYSAEIVSSENTVLNTTSFRIPLQILYDNFDENGTAIGGGEITKNYTTWIIILPYFENAKEINIYDSNGTKKLTIDVSMYSKNITTTAEEAKPATAENITGKPAITSEKDRFNRIVAVIIISAIVIIAAIIIIKPRKKENE